MKKRSGKSAPQLSEELGKAINLHQNGQFQQAKVIYKKIIRYSPNHPDALHMLGILYTQTGKLETAIDLMRKSIQYAPGRPDCLFNLARAYHDLGNLDEAIATYQEYLRLVPDDLEALHLLGRVWHDKKAFEQAIIYYRRALEKSPERVDFLNSLGLTYHAQGDFEQAIICYEQALKYQPNDFIVLNNLGDTFRRIKKLDKAVSCFRQALSVRPNDAKVFNNLGIVFREEGKLEEATENFKLAVSAKPGYAEAHYNLGLVFGAQKMFVEAANSFRQAISAKPDYAEAHCNLGSLYQEQGRLDEAVKSMQIAVGDAPGDSLILECLINLLNHYVPQIDTGCPYVKVQESLQQVRTEETSTLMITDETVRQLYQQCHRILGHHNLLDIYTNKSQLYRGASPPNDCARYRMLFDKFNIIPAYCFGCYKVTIEPRTVMELFKLLLVFDKLKLPKNNERKCIVEMRPEIAGTYKGFIYCKSLNEGKEILNIVQPIVDETIAKGIPIFVKRGCSEFPIAYPAYGHITDNKIQEMTYNEEWRKHEAAADKNMIIQSYDNPNDFTHNHSGFTLLDILVMRKWLAYAEKIGDLSYLKIVE
jgi:tetratricopeptide (TPR) repeat protein